MLKKAQKKNGFTLIELMVVIVIIGILVAIALPNFVSAQDRAKTASVKSNMHTLQTMLETYSVDWAGVYPTDLGDGTSALPGLMLEAKNRNYEKKLKNPFSGKEGSGFAYHDFVSGSPAFVANLNTYPNLEGMLDYENSGNTKYYIYGGTKDNYPVSDKAQVFFLSNQ